MQHRKVEAWEILFIIYMFLSIFNPDFFPVEMSTIMRNLGIVYILLYFVRRKKIIVNKNFILMFCSFVPFFLYLVLNTLLQSFIDPSHMQEFILNTRIIFGTFLNSFVCCFVVLILVERKNILPEQLIDDLIIVGLIQTICVLLAFMSPTIREIFNNFTIMNSPSQHLISYVLTNDQRCFGLADNLFDSFGYTTSMLIIPMFIYGVEKDKKYFFVFLMMLMMPLLNTRTGLILILISAAIVVFYFSKRVFYKNFYKYIIIIPVTIIGITKLYSILPENTRNWIKLGREAITALLFENKKISTFATISKMVGIPNDFLFGKGASPEALSMGNTDLGYIQSIWRFGLIGTVLLLGAFAFIFFRMYKTSTIKSVKCYIICVAAIFFIYLWKLYSLGNNCGNFMVFSLMAVALNGKLIQRRNL